MSKENQQVPELDPLQREAVAWVQQLISGHATPDDAAALKRWRGQSAAHAAAFAEASRAWSDVGPAGLRLRQRGGEMDSGLAYWRRRTMNRRAVLGGGLATAAAAAYAVVHPPFDLWPSLSELNADYRTGIGEQRSVKFADDVSIRMNTQTSIAIQPAEGERDRIELIAGEASFTMPVQARRSLAVLAAAGTTVANGARFDLRRTSGRAGTSVCLTCLEGSVRVEHGIETAALGPGQQLSYDARGLSRAIAVDPESASDWQRGIVVFRSTPLAEVVEEINRYRPGRIILINAALGTKQVSGRFRIDQMDEILSRLELAFSARIQALPGGIVLLS